MPKSPNEDPKFCPRKRWAEINGEPLWEITMENNLRAQKDLLFAMIKKGPFLLQDLAKGSGMTKEKVTDVCRKMILKSDYPIRRTKTKNGVYYSLKT